MQQTENLKLNIIEGGDAVSPEPINENMALLEAAIEEKGSAIEAVAASLGSGGKTCRIAWGSYVGTDTYGPSGPCSLTFDFRPMVVMVRVNQFRNHSTFIRAATSGETTYASGSALVASWGDHSVQWYSTESAIIQNNFQGYTYHYVALGYAD